MTWVVVACVVLWWGLSASLDRLTIPAWQARNAYRWLSLALMLALMLVAHKASLYRQELRFQIQTCR